MSQKCENIFIDPEIQYCKENKAIGIVFQLLSQQDALELCIIGLSDTGDESSDMGRSVYMH